MEAETEETIRHRQLNLFSGEIHLITATIGGKKDRNQKSLDEQ